MNRDHIHKAISQKQEELTQWFFKKREGVPLPFYSSFDIRDSGFKVAPVDANLFPAGFNNICQVDKETSADIVKEYLNAHYPGISKVALLTEEHTNNPYYWDNVHTLKSLIEEAGKSVVVSLPRQIPEPIKVESASGQFIEVHGAKILGNKVEVNGESPDLVVCNNDFSTEYEEWKGRVETPMNPPRELGWYRRKKCSFFVQYNKLVKEFCEIIDVDPWELTVSTEVHKEFDINSEESREKLATHVDEFIAKLKEENTKRGIGAEPMVFVKNNAGTYGLGVTSVNSGDDIRAWNNKSRKKMKAAKGGGGFTEVIIQEGIPTALEAEGSTAEPVIYMLGCQLAGGFLRTHSKKGPEDSLNSPGAVYKRLCVSDLNVDVEGNPMENVYGWVARLGFLANSHEAKEAGVSFLNYKDAPCG